MDVSIPAIKVCCFGVGFGEGGCSDSFGVGVVVGGLSGFVARRPDCACARQQTIKIRKLLNEMFRHSLVSLILNSLSPLRNISHLFLECTARLVRARRVNSRSSLLDVADDPVFVNDECGAGANKPLLVKDAVGSDYLSLDVAQQRESHTDVFLETIVGGVAVNADTDNLRVALFKVGNISLIRLQFLRSTSGEGEHVEGERNVLLAPEVAELDGLSIRVCEGKVGCHVTHLELRLWGAWLLRSCAAVTRTRDISQLVLGLRRPLTTLNA